jgi:hypothetical protein
VGDALNDTEVTRMETKAVRKLVTLDDAIRRRLEDYRFGQRISRESDALRRLIEIGLDHVETAEGRQTAPAGR